MLKNGKLFGIINIIDFFIILAILLAGAGLMLVKSGKYVTSSNVIKETKPIEFDVLFKFQRITGNGNFFIPGEKAFITIRNVPYTALDIVKSTKTHTKTIDQTGIKPVVIDDMSAPYTYDYLVTLKDKAIITDDSAVIGGNKIKTGLKVTLEGNKYRLDGVVSDVRW